MPVVASLVARLADAGLAVNPPAPTVLPLRVWVPGRARTKGSLRPQGRRLVEQVARSKDWRQQVAETVLRTYGAVPGPTGFTRWWQPASGPVVASLTVWLPRPAALRADAGPRWDWPISIYDGDLDKLQRNIGDALTDTGVIADDSLIVGWTAWKLWAATATGAGALIELRDVRDVIGVTQVDTSGASAQVGARAPRL